MVQARDEACVARIVRAELGERKADAALKAVQAELSAVKSADAEVCEALVRLRAGLAADMSRLAALEEEIERQSGEIAEAKLELAMEAVEAEFAEEELRRRRDARQR
jgi:hypothetical protein